MRKPSRDLQCEIFYRLINDYISIIEKAEQILLLTLFSERSRTVIPDEASTRVSNTFLAKWRGRWLSDKHSEDKDLAETRCTNVSLWNHLVGYSRWNLPCRTECKSMESL